MLIETFGENYVIVYVNLLLKKKRTVTSIKLFFQELWNVENGNLS